MKRKFYTAADIELLNARGIKELTVDENDVVLELAKEAAERNGITIKLKSTVELITQKKGGSFCHASL